MGNIGLTELIIILVIVLVLFGATKLPALARSLGRSLGEFKKGRQEGEQEVKKAEADPGKGDEVDKTKQ
jgi:sec-independent protein translocase protein TatA